MSADTNPLAVDQPAIAPEFTVAGARLAVRGLRWAVVTVDRPTSFEAPREQLDEVTALGRTLAAHATVAGCERFRFGCERHRWTFVIHSLYLAQLIAAIDGIEAGQYRASRDLQAELVADPRVEKVLRRFGRPWRP